MMMLRRFSSYRAFGCYRAEEQGMGILKQDMIILGPVPSNWCCKVDIHRTLDIDCTRSKQLPWIPARCPVSRTPEYTCRWQFCEIPGVTPDETSC